MKLRLAFLATSALSLLCAAAHAQQPYPQQQQQPAPQPYQPPPQQYPPQNQPAPQPQPYPPPQQQPYPQQPQQQPPPPQQYQPLPPPQPPPPQNYPQQYPPQQQPYQPLPPQQQQQPYPPQQQPYPPPQQQYPQQQYPQQQQQQYPQQQQQQPSFQQQQPQQHPAQNGQAPRGNGEMFFLYGTSIAYGVGTGIWIDALAGASDPGIAIIAPIALGAAMPVGVYFLDQNVPLHFGTPSAMSAGMILGAVEGVAISGVQYQHSSDTGHWGFGGYSTVTFIGATAGGFGGYAFGEWAHLDPRNMAFIGSGAGWGAISGTFLGAGIENGPDWKDGGSIAGLIGFNAGIAATGAIAMFYTPSWYSQKWMWLGYLAGTAGASIVYPFYAADSNSAKDIHHGLIANGLGGLAGVALAGALTVGAKDDGAKSAINNLPFQLGVSPTQGGGATVQAFGIW